MYLTSSKSDNSIWIYGSIHGYIIIHVWHAFNIKHNVNSINLTGSSHACASSQTDNIFDKGMFCCLKSPLVFHYFSDGLEAPTSEAWQMTKSSLFNARRLYISRYNTSTMFVSGLNKELLNVHVVYRLELSSTKVWSLTGYSTDVGLHFNVVQGTHKRQIKVKISAMCPRYPDFWSLVLVKFPTMQLSILLWTPCPVNSHTFQTTQNSYIQLEEHEYSFQ